MSTSPSELWRQGQLPQAEAACRQALRDNPQDAGAWHVLGLVRLRLRDFAEAIAGLDRAVQLTGAHSPASAPLLCDLGAAQAMSGRADLAAETFERAILADANSITAWNNLGNARKACGRSSEALAAYRRAIELSTRDPSSAGSAAVASAFYNLGNLLRDGGQYGEAIEQYRQAERLAPGRVDVLGNLGSALQLNEQTQAAAATYRRALAIDPESAEVLFNLGSLLGERDAIEEGTELVERAARLRPDRSLWPMRAAGFCPTIFASVDELHAYREKLAAKLDQFAGQRISPRSENQILEEAFFPSFNLAHHGDSNRDLMGKFAAIYAPLIGRREPRLRTGGLPRIGFVVTSPHEGGFLRTMGGTINQLDPSRFETVVFCPTRSLGLCKSVIPRASIEWVPLPSGFSQAADAIRDAGCQVLYFHKVGADPLGYLLPFARLAEVQCTSWSTHMTSGVPEVDYYLSSRSIESEQADEHYSERLIRFDSFPILEATPAALRTATRGEFNLPAQGTLYACPLRLPKFHPADDLLLRGILEADPSGWLLIVAPRERERAVEQLLARFALTLGRCAQRVVTLPVRQHAEFRRMLSVCDVFLDLRSFGSGLMAYDALWADLPIVSMPGPLKVQRYGSAFYSQMGMAGPIAHTDAEYVELAVRLAADTDYRRTMRGQIAAAKGKLFDDPRVVQEYQRFFEAMVTERKVK